jgi:hypothetical protein
MKELVSCFATKTGNQEYFLPTIPIYS